MTSFVVPSARVILWAMGLLSDTSPAIWDVYYRRIAQMTPSERVQIAAALWTSGHQLQCAAVRQRFPDADDGEVIFQVAVARFGEELASKAYGRK